MKTKLNRHTGRLLKNAPERRVRARGLQDSFGSHAICRPGALTGRVVQRAPRDRDPLLAFTLIEVLAVLAIIAILAVIIAPNLLKQLDFTAGSQETATLQSLGNALQSSILRNFYIPGATDWATNIATELGLDPNDVSTNASRKARVFLIDPQFSIGVNGSGLPYTQGTNGSYVTNSSGWLIPPVNPRVMILSSMTMPLPASVVSGVPSTSGDFSNIWNTADGFLPPTTSFTGWNGANYLHIQRINLSSLFVQLVLSTYSSTGIGQYAINPASPFLGGTNAAPTNSSGFRAYFLQNTTLRLINNTLPSNTNVDSDQILIHDTSFVYNQDVWRASITTTNIAPSSAGAGAVGSDFSVIVANFLTTPSNPNALGGATQGILVNDMINYLNAYDAWAALGTFPTSGSLYSAATAAQATMQTDINNLINGL